MRVLFVSIAFPPKNDPECLQTGKYFYYLAKKDLTIDVLTSADPTLFMGTDKFLQKYDQGWNNKYELNIPENKYSNYLFRKILPFGIDYPDSKFLFYRQWKKAVNKINDKPDIIYSRSYPLSSAIMAYHLTGYYRVPWIMHLSDPWLLSPIHRYNKWQLKYHQKWERKCFEAADKICMTSRKTIELYRNYYPEYKRKFKYFPNVYDPNDIKDNPIVFGRKLRFVYTGGLTKERSVKWFIPVFEDLLKENPNISDDIEFIFAGDMDKENRILFQEYAFPFVKHVGIVSYQQALELQSSAQILINIDNPVKNHKEAVFFPSKLLDYFKAQRRIICLTTSGSTSYEVLKEYPSDICENDDSSSLKRFIKQAISEFKKNNIRYFVVNQIPEKYSASKNAKYLFELLQEVIDGDLNSPGSIKHY